jgi:DNA-binding NtrC family response regulator
MSNILFVDGDRSARDLVRCMLEDKGFYVHAVANAEVALLLLREQIHFDLLLTDAVFPGGMDGFTLADEAARIRPGLRVIYLTGFVNLPRRRLAELRGKLLVKPVRPFQLVNEVRGLLASAA